MLPTTSTLQNTALVGEVKKLDESDHKGHRDRVKLAIEMYRDGAGDVRADGDDKGEGEEDEGRGKAK